MIKTPPIENQIDSNIAMAEAADDSGEFAWHEEVDSKINETTDQSSDTSNQAEDFTKDL